MSAASTLAPSRTNTCEHARAMPEPAPVMTATFPWSSLMGFPSPANAERVLSTRGCRTQRSASERREHAFCEAGERVRSRPLAAIAGGDEQVARPCPVGRRRRRKTKQCLAVQDLRDHLLIREPGVRALFD